MPRRKKIPLQTKIDVLIEAGYRCGNPACGTILTLDIHHIEAVAEGGDDDPSNLLPLCPNCHAQYERHIIPKAAIHHWKRMLTALNHSFDREAMDLLLFLRDKQWSFLSHYTPDGVSRFAGLIVAGLVEAEEHPETPVAVKLAQLPFVFSLWKQVRDEVPVLEGRFADLLSAAARRGSEEGPDVSPTLQKAIDRMPQLREITDEVEGVIGDAVTAWESGNTDWYRPVLYNLKLTQRGEMLVDAWLSGDEAKYVESLSVDQATDVPKTDE